MTPFLAHVQRTAKSGELLVRKNMVTGDHFFPSIPNISCKLPFISLVFALSQFHIIYSYVMATIERFGSETRRKYETSAL